MKIICLELVPFEQAQSVAHWAEDRGYDFSVRRMHLGEELPQPAEFDMLVILGGSMGVHDVLEFPWLVKLRELIALAIARGRKVVGICLGAQLIALSLGAEVRKNHEPEIGWFGITLSPEANHLHGLRSLPQSFTTFLWHGDTFELPRGASPIGSSKGCVNQGFVLGDLALALQFHPEVTEQGIEALLENCSDHLEPGPFVQTAEQIRNGKEHIPANKQLLYSMLDHFSE